MTKKREKPGPKPVADVNDEFLNKIEELSSKEFTQEQIRAHFGIKKGSWYLLSKKHPEIKKRIKKGRTKTLDFVVSKFFEKVEEGDVKCILFYLERKAKWLQESKFNLDAKIKTDKNSPLELKITTTDPIEAGRIYEQIMTTTGS